MSGTAPKSRPVALRLDGITKRFGAVLANDAISLEVAQGEVLALLGENGAGKTTLMNILFGHYTADQGRIEVLGEALPAGQPRAALDRGVGMVHQHFTLAENLTVLDNLLLGTRPLFGLRLNRGAARARIAALAQDFGLAVDPDARVADLSVGERQRVEILKALYRKARVLILDEPTAVLTPQEAEALFATLRHAVAQGLAVIFISHKLHEVIGIADRVVVLRHGRVVGEVAVADTDPARLAAMMVGAEIRSPAIPTVAEGAVALRLERVATQGFHPDLVNASLDLVAGRITGLAGVSGNGQGALAALIAGLAVPVAGRFQIGGRDIPDWSPLAAIGQGVARIPEDRHHAGTIGDFTLTENAVIERLRDPRFSRHGWIDWRAARRHAEGLIYGYDIRCSGPDARIRLLSGGNMQKLILGRALEESPAIILANQPVRGLDIGAVRFVQERLLAARARGAAILLISEDLEEVMALSDVIHVISDGRLSPQFPRGSMSAADLGLWMAGQGFDHAA
ncbi:ABC transporter ATP-binding protein [Paracoccus aestuariivivens]|uniref:ATP-binding cassette domain-containing protein n=1 Tax=Paracoccus aestuariivivens TaxID=1820333 RepID=A0A6L6JF53_9RHOB|nr:ABC transporter ATP-binding protein [Paracoccus aestuariivivens]MTH79227.1 ATP-binding cassette domain-containing protein [Paracoccus aestuariivivens]